MATTKSAAATAAEEDEAQLVREVLNNASLRLKSEKWFDFMQDDGVEMTSIEKEQFGADEKKRKRLRVRHGEYLFSGIYDLGKLMAILYQTNGIPADEDDITAAFPKMAMSQSGLSTATNTIGSFIVKNRKKIARADINSITDTDFIENTKRDAMNNRTHF
jgi:hypothetical protein